MHLLERTAPMHDYKVYIHRNLINGKCYIGQTHLSLNKRFGRNGSRYKNCISFGRAIDKYGWDNFSHTVLFDNLTKEEADYLERLYIKRYNTKDPNYGYNLTDGGDGVVGNRQTAWNKGLKMNKEFCEKMKGYSHPNKMKGKKLPEEWRLKLCHKKSVGPWNKGIPNKSSMKRVIQLTLNDEFINEYESVKEASIKTGSNASAIASVCRGSLPHTNGFHWKYKEVA